LQRRARLSAAQDWRSRTDSFLEQLEHTSLADLLHYQRAHPDSRYPFPSSIQPIESTHSGRSVSAPTPLTSLK